MLKYSGNLEARIDGMTPLMEAISINNVSFINVLLELGVDVNQTDASGRTALKMAIQMGAQREVFEALVKS